MKLTILLVILSLSISLFAQQDSRYRYSMSNPAYSGNKYKHFGAASFKSIVFDNNAKIFNNPNYNIAMNYDAKISKINSGIGLGYEFTKLGFESDNRINLNYAYQLELNKGILGFGISGIYNRRKIYGVWITPSELNNTNINNNEMPTTIENNYYTNIGTYYSSEKFEIGISIVNMDNFKNLYYLINGLYNFKLSESFNLKTGAKVYTNIISIDIDVYSYLVFKKEYWLGLSYRYDWSELGIIAGTDIKEKYRLGLIVNTDLNLNKNSQSNYNEFYYVSLFTAIIIK